VADLPEAILSNDLERLLEVLVEDISLASSLSLVKARIIVPDSSIRAWLSHELAKRELSLLRFDIVLLEEALEQRSEKTLPLTRFNLLPLLISFFECAQKKNLLSLPCQDTAEARYHLAKRILLPFAMRAFLGEKERFSNERIPENFWQEFIQWCPSPFHGVKTTSFFPSCTPLFLFGFCSLSPLLLNQVLGLPSLRGLYLLSPCMLFWGDQSSNREMRFLLFTHAVRHAQRPSAEQLEQFLNDRHRLLANSGQIGREFMHLLEESRLQTRSMYVLKKALAKPPYSEYLLPEVAISDIEEATLLDRLKADLLLLVSKTEKLHPVSRDRSIEIHGAPTPLREVEALRERLLECRSLLPASVIVLVTDLPRYQAAIEQAMGGQIPYQIWGKTSESSIITVFRMIVSMLMSKGTIHDWMQLLRHPLFQTTLLISKDEAESVIEWLSSRPSLWGFSPNHRNRYLSSRSIPSSASQSRTFEEDKDLLLSSFLSSSSEEGLEVSLLRPLGNFLHFVSLMEGWWLLPLQGAECAPMSRFAQLINHILGELLKRPSGGFEEDALIHAQSLFAKISSQAEDPSIPASESLKLFFRLVDSDLSRSCMVLSAPVIVAEFGAFQPFPAELIAILGAQEGALPQHSEDMLLDHLDQLVPKIPASNAFFDRYRFLEAILQARNLFISYQSYSFETRERMLYSPVVADLLLHLDANYLIDGSAPSSKVLVEHPLIPHRRSKDKSFPSSPAIHLSKEPPSSSIDISIVQRAARSPLDLFYKEQYGFSTSFSQEESIFLQPWQIRMNLEKNLGAEVPSMSHPQYQRPFIGLLSSLRSLGLAPKPFALHLLPTIASPVYSEAAIFAPLIPSTPSLMGSWNGLVVEGIVLFTKDWKRELFKRWPENALRTYLSMQHNISMQRQAIIVQEEGILPLPKSDSLSAWAEFAATASTIPMPLTFDIVKLLLSHPSSADVFQAIDKEAQAELGPWHAFSSTISLEDCSRYLPQWERYASLLWSDYFAAVEGL
jgi:hypothetical protein